MAEEAQQETFFERTLSNLRHAWFDIAAGVGLAREEEASDVRALRTLMRECLEKRGGEVSARARAAELGRRYLELDMEGRTRFLKTLAQDFSVSRKDAEAAIDRYQSASDDSARLAAEHAMRKTLVPPYREIITQFNALPTGVKFIVDLRADLRRVKGEDPYLSSMDDELRQLLLSWFDVGFLDLRRIDWNSPASLLEKLIAYEAVHEIESWSDLRNRLDSDRRCYALFHLRMPEEPLAFVEVALTEKMAGSVQNLLDQEAPEGDPEKAEAAIFYSITNTQQGLHSVSFGDFLIKGVVNEINRDLPQIKTFATLSPIPGFRSWFDHADPADLAPLIDDGEAKAIRKLSREEDAVTGLRQLAFREGWHRHERLAEVMREPMMRICARYLVSRRADGRPRDPVARFHLRNGARLERINWLGDVSRKGLRQSAGMMVNYRYRIDDIEENHEAYERDGRIVVASAVRSLLRGRKDAEGRALTRYTEGSPDAEDENGNGDSKNSGRKRKAGRSAAKSEDGGKSDGADEKAKKMGGRDKEPAA